VVDVAGYNRLAGADEDCSGEKRQATL